MRQVPVSAVPLLVVVTTASEVLGMLSSNVLTIFIPTSILPATPFVAKWQECPFYLILFLNLQNEFQPNLAQSILGGNSSLLTF